MDTDAHLLDHADALRRLARALLRDADAAADAVQETWLRALRSEPPRGSGLRPWLETVLRRVVSNRRREAGRRRARERAAAVAEDSAASAASLAARRDTLRALLDAVEGMPAALQECVQRRYFEDQPPRAIARALGLPVGTVYDRLDRARRQLRERLAERHGDGAAWRGALAACLGVGPGSRPGWGLVMGGKGKAMLAAVLMLLLLLALTLSQSGGDGRSGGDAAAGGGSLAGVDAQAPEPLRAVRQPAALRPVPGDADMPPREPPRPQQFDLAVLIRVVDHRDLPAVGVPVYAAPIGMPLNFVDWSDGDGFVLVRFVAMQPEAVLALAATGGRGLRSAVARTGTVIEAVLRLGEVPDAEPIPGPKAFRKGYPPGYTSFRVDPSEQAAERPLGERKPAAPLATAAVRGTVRDALGHPLTPPPRVYAWSVRETFAEARSVTCAADGSFVLDGVPTGMLRIHAGGGAQPAASAELLVANEAGATWTAVVDPGRTVEGMIEWAGRPRSGVQVVVECAGERWVDASRSGEDGRFRIHNLRGEPSRLLLFTDAAPEVPFADQPAPTDTYWLVAMPEPEPGTLELIGGGPLPQVWTADRRFGVLGRPSLHLPAGRYHLLDASGATLLEVDVLAGRMRAVQLERELRGDRPRSSRIDAWLVRPDVAPTVWLRGRVQELESNLPFGTYRWQRGSGRAPDRPPEFTIGLR